MASKTSTDCMVTVTIELGHQANFLKEPSPEGFTHEWTVFVRGYEGSKIENFVEKVVFKLHKTFKMPTRVIHKPPFKVTESGYAGFHLLIEIHFKNKQSPRKIQFLYDLFLNAPDNPPINNIRYEKLKFQNPTPEFKAKLIKAGGTEHGTLPEILGSPPKTILEKKPKTSSQVKEKHKKVKKVKKSPVREESPSSLPSLSPTTSDEELEKHVPAKEWVPPPQLKKEPSIKKDTSSSDKVKYKQDISSHKTKPVSEKDKEVKVHKNKEKNTSSHHKDGSKKEKESKSHKSKDSHEKHKEREGSHSSSKSSSSSHGEKSASHGEKSGSHGEKKNSSSHSSSKDKLSNKDKERDGVDSTKKHKSSHKSKEREEKSGLKHKIKESSVPLQDSSSSVEQNKKLKENSSKTKSSSEKEKTSKFSLKRSSTSPVLEGERELKKLKRSSSTGSEERVSIKPSSSEKDKSNSNNSSSSSSVSKDKKEVKPKDKDVVKSTTSDVKSKHSKNKHSSKSKSTTHQSGDKPKSSKDSAGLDSSSSKHKDKLSKLTKNDSLTAEQLAKTADFQPQLLLSPVRSQSDDEDQSITSASRSSSVQKKRNKSNSSLNSPSSLSGESNKSENEGEKPKQILSDLFDSDSDHEKLPVKSPLKESKPTSKNSTHSHSGVKKSKQSIPYQGEGEKSRTSKPQDPFKLEDVKGNKHETSMAKSGDKDRGVSGHHVVHENKNGLDVLAPNGIPVGELISINDKIEQAQEKDDVELINKVIDIIADSDFELDESALSFDICSLERNLVIQIKNLLRD